MPKILPRALSAAAFLILLTLCACVDPNSGGGSTSNTGMYVFNSASGTNVDRILVWDDLTALYGLPSTPPTRRIQAQILDEIGPTLAWGGMVMDPVGGKLYSVSTDGTVVRIENVRSKSGSLSSNTDIVSFTLGDPGTPEDRLSGGSFGQAAFDGGTLYVTETNDSVARIWVVANAAGQVSGAKVPRVTHSVSGDKSGAGVCVTNGTLYGYFENGSTVSIGGTDYTGPRLRKGSSSGFSDVPSTTAVIFPSDIKKYGSMAIDTGSSNIFFARHLTENGLSGASLLVYTAGSFGASARPTPAYSLGSGLTSLRIISHAGNKDWLGGATSANGTASNLVYLWKNPIGGEAPVTVSLTGGMLVRGLALDGNN